jgi:zinc/manganese transport system permease protein
VTTLAATASLIGFASGALGLLVSFHFNLPSGPAIVLMAGLAYLFSILFGIKGGMARVYFRKPHFHNGKEL